MTDPSGRKRPLPNEDQPPAKKRAPFQDVSNTTAVVPQASNNTTTRSTARKVPIRTQTQEFLELDRDFMNDPAYCTEYIQDIMKYLLGAESAVEDYYKHQTDINERMMAILVNWLVEVVSYFNLPSCCLFLAKALVDKMLASTPNMQRDRLQLLGLSALFIAAKFEDSSPPTTHKLSTISDDTYSPDEILTMENQILRGLEFLVSIPTLPQFLDRFLQAACFEIVDEYLKARVCKLARFYSECSLHHGKMHLFKPSIVAISSVILALHACGMTPWNSTLAKVSSIDYQNPSLLNCVKNLFDCITNFPTSLTASREKYFADNVPPLPANIPPMFRPPSPILSNARRVY